MKIAFISTLSHSPWGGSEELWHRTALYALKHNHHVHAVVYNGGYDHPKIVQLIALKASVSYRQRIKSDKTLLEKSFLYLSKILKKKDASLNALSQFKPDVICISQGGTFDSAYEDNNDLRLYIEKQHCPYFIICQNNVDVGFVPEEEVRGIALHFFSKAKNLFFVSRRNLIVAERQMCHNLNNALVISNPVNLRIPAIQEYPKTDSINFAIVASLTCSHKGQDYLFQILSSEIWQRRNWVLNLYGTGKDENYLKQLSVYYQINHRVFFKGHVDDIEAVWQKNHIFLLPTLGEGTPLALVEAALCGRPAVVTDVAGNTNITIDMETGFVATAPTFMLYNEALEKAWNNRDRWAEIGRNAYFHVLKTIDLTPDKTLLEILTGKK